jgi:hypothetical protein
MRPQEFFMANRHCSDGSTLVVQVNLCMPAHCSN